MTAPERPSVANVHPMDRTPSMPLPRTSLEWLRGRQGARVAAATLERLQQQEAAAQAGAILRPGGYEEVVDHTDGPYAAPDLPAFPKEYDPAWSDPLRYAE